MMTPEQRQIAEEIADYVRRKVFEAGICLEIQDSDCYGRWHCVLSWDRDEELEVWCSQAGEPGIVYYKDDGGPSTARRLLDEPRLYEHHPQANPMLLRALREGIPDLSDDATIDALIRHLRRRGWRFTRGDGKASARRSAMLAGRWGAAFSMGPEHEIVIAAIETEIDNEGVRDDA